MTVIAMSRREIDRMHVLRDMAAGRITASEAAQLMRLTRRHVFRLAKAYRERGPAALISTRRGKPSNRPYPAALRTDVLALIKANSPDCVPAGQGVSGARAGGADLDAPRQAQQSSLSG